MEPGTYHFSCMTLDGPVSLFYLLLSIGGFGVGLQDVAFPGHTDVTLQVPLRASPDVARVCEQGPLVTELMTCKSVLTAQIPCTAGSSRCSKFCPTPQASLTLLLGGCSSSQYSQPHSAPPLQFPPLLLFPPSFLSSPTCHRYLESLPPSADHLDKLLAWTGQEDISGVEKSHILSKAVNGAHGSFCSAYSVSPNLKSSYKIQTSG